MSTTSGHLIHGPLPNGTLHLCIDMQCLFDRGGPWPTPWMERVRPNVLALATFSPAKTIFTRFIPPGRADDSEGSWRRFYQRWPEATGEHLDVSLVELLPELKDLQDHAHLIDRRFYSAYQDSGLLDLLRAHQCEAVIVSGAETDVCVLATVLDTVDLGIRCIVAADAICSSNDETHAAMMTLYEQRFGMQVETATTHQILEEWGLVVGHPEAGDKTVVSTTHRADVGKTHRCDA